MACSEAAKLLCGDYAAEWVDVLLTCHLKLWGKTPGYPKLAQTLHEWRTQGWIDPLFAEAFRPKPKPRDAPSPPPRATRDDAQSIADQIRRDLFK